MKLNSYLFDKYSSSSFLLFFEKDAKRGIKAQNLRATWQRKRVEIERKRAERAEANAARFVKDANATAGRGSRSKKNKVG